METKRVKILTIDDNYDNIVVLNALLRETFPLAELLAAQSGKKGIELCQEHLPDLILLDIVMPEMDGYEVCRILKGYEHLKHIPIVIVTAAHTDRDGRIKALEAGADGFLSKPLDESELKVQVIAMLKIKESEDRKIDEKERLEKLVRERTKALETEIGERKRVEKSLNDTNRKFVEAQRIAHIGNFERNIETNETFWSDETYQIFGIPIGTKINWNEVKHCLAAEDLLRMDQALMNATVGDNNFSIDFKITRPDGSVRYIQEENEVIFDKSGKPILIMGTSQDITERKIIEIALKESDEHFQMLFNNAPVGYQSLDIDGNFIVVNDTWLEIMGYEREEVIGKWFGDFLAPHFKEAFRERFPLFKKWGKVHSEFEMVKKDGSIIFAAFEGRIGHTVTGEFKQTHCVINDVTEQRRKDIELKETYEFNNSLLKTIPFGMDIVDEQGNVLFQNDIFKDLFGGNGVGKKCWEIYRDDKTQCEDCPLKDKIEFGNTAIRQSSGIHEGKTFEISHTGMMFKGKKAMLEIFQDISERKRDELIQKVLFAISSAVLTTKDVEEFSVFIMKQLSQLLDTANFRIALYDAETDMLTSQSYADQVEDVTSWIADRSVTGYLIRQDRSLLLTRADIDELIGNDEIDSKGIPCEVWLGVPMHEDGKVVGAFILQNYEDVNAYTLKDLELLEFVSYQISLSLQRKKSIQDLMIALDKAEESDKLKTAFLSNMSHEIRTPMNGILGFSELLDDDDLSAEERRKFLDIINTNGHHLLSVINDILDIAKIDSDQLIINKIPFNLHFLLGELLVSYENNKIVMGKEQITFLIEKDLPDDNCIIICDETRLRQILYNLLSNALKFTKSGYIKFGYRHLDGKLEFFVQDTGKGISPAHQSIIFERFRQEEETYTRQFGGTGLGLSISKKLVELLGGEMWLVSEQGSGSTFYFTIPYTVSVKNKDIEKKNRHLLDVHLKNKTILIVDDDQYNQALFEFYLEPTGAQLLFAEDGKDAVEKSQAHSEINLVLMDIKMPVLNGLDATKEIRKFNQQVPIIAITAYVLAVDRLLCTEAGCNEFISKPIDADELFRKISTLISQ
jgi:PAS domain S-box-containing protein